MQAQRIVVVGMPLSGKTSVYRRLLVSDHEPDSEIWALYELDVEIEVYAGRSIPEIFAEEGEAGFRIKERETLRRLLSLRETETAEDGVLEEDGVLDKSVLQGGKDRMIVFAGGGAVQPSQTREVLRAFDKIVYLRTSLSSLQLRLSEEEAGRRPLFQTDDPMETMRLLYETRTPLYEEIATDTIDTDGRTAEEVTEMLIDLVRNAD